MSKSDKGYFQVSNGFQSALCRLRIPGEVNQVFNFIMRKTFGWSKEGDWIALSQFVDGTGLSKKTIVKARQKLVSMNLIFVSQLGDKKKISQLGEGKNLTYRINEDFKSWKPLPKKGKGPTASLRGRISIRDIKRKVRERDANTCLSCGYDGNLTSENLHVHHINLNEGNNDLSNLITVCRSCHGKGHSNNEAVRSHYRNLVTQKGEEKESPKKVIEVTQLGYLSSPNSPPTKDTSTKNTLTKSPTERRAPNPTHTVILHFAKKFEECLGTQFVISWGRHGNIAKLLLKTHPPGEVCTRIDRYFALSSDDWRVRKGRDLNGFCTHFNTLAEEKKQDGYSGFADKDYNAGTF